MRLPLIFLFALFSTVFSTVAVAQSCQAEQACVNEQQLYLSWALGYGERSNPLHGGEELQLVILPEIYYYGKHWFFDNGKLGSSWALSEQWQLSLVTQFNQEKGYFRKWFSGNVLQPDQLKFAPSMVGPSMIAEQERAAPPVYISEVSKRPTAVDAGIQLDWFSGAWQAHTALWQDISNTYQGQHASVGLSRSWQNQLGKWQLTGNVYWKSAKLIDTYYGIDDNEASSLTRYSAGSSWQPELRLSWSKPLTERVALLAFLRYLHLDDAMTDSPLVRADHVTTWFFGVSYRFY